MGKPTKILHNVAVGVVLNDVLDPLIAVLISAMLRFSRIDQQLSLDKLVGCQRICLGELGLDFQPSFVVVVCPYGCDELAAW